MTYSLIVRPSGHSKFAAYARIFSGDKAIMNGMVSVRHIPQLVAALMKLNRSHSGDKDQQ